MHVGPEPTTDGFQAILYGPAERQLPGNALVTNPASAFRELAQFGQNFLARFSGCEVTSDFARGCTLIDTPGILAGRKQTVDRNYSYEDVLRWFAPRADIILLMFDANKVDISDELKDVIKILEPYDEKIRVVLNKADHMDPSDLLKVNSALTWALARILKAPEVRRIYVGSFWDQPLQPSYMAELFEKESHALLADLASAPRNNTTSKLNDLVYRTRMVRVQALIFHELRVAMPKMTGRDKKQKELIAGVRTRRRCSNARTPHEAVADAAVATRGGSDTLCSVRSLLLACCMPSALTRPMSDPPTYPCESWRTSSLRS